MPENNKKIRISLYELYAMGINTLLKKAPIASGQKISVYRESFMYEQRVIGLSILSLIGEEHVPKAVLKTMPDFPEQVRDSVNQAVFLRALKHHYRHLPQGDDLAEQIMGRMVSYVAAVRDAKAHDSDPHEALALMLAKRIPPKTDAQKVLYLENVRKIFDYTEKLISRSLAEKYEIVK